MSERMLEIENRWHSVQTTYSEPPIEYIKGIAENISHIVESYCETAGIDKNRINCCYPTIKDIVIRLDMRLLYFQIYHNKMEINEYKLICGLLIFWILKLHPFWITIDAGDDKEMINIATNINEQIALHIAICLLKEYNPSFFENGKNLVGQYCKELLYSFRYRDLSKESLFLMFDPFYFLHLFEASVDTTGKSKI